MYFPRVMYRLSPPKLRYYLEWAWRNDYASCCLCTNSGQWSGNEIKGRKFERKYYWRGCNTVKRRVLVPCVGWTRCLGKCFKAGVLNGQNGFWACDCHKHKWCRENVLNEKSNRKIGAQFVQFIGFGYSRQTGQFHS